jgi:anti-sigma factor RsiW
MTPTMSHERAWEMLPDYVGGYLSDEQQSAVKRHLRQCRQCRQEVAATEALRAGARTLPESIAPPRDLWAGIAARIGAPQAGPETAAAGAGGQRQAAPPRWSRRLLRLRPRVWVWPSLAVGATALLAVVLLTTGRGPLEPPGGQAGTAVESAFAALESECRMGEEEFLAAAAEAPAQDGGGTLALIKANLHAVDLAIQQAQDAWRDNPHSPHLMRMVIAAYRAKASLLGDAHTLLRTT